MAWFLYAISAAWIAFGSCAILYTPQTREATSAFIHQTPTKVMAAIPFICGVLFLIAASSGIHPWVIRAFGVLAMLKGVFIFLNPNDLYQKTLQWYLETLSDQAHRFMGILTVILGTALLSWIL